MLIPVFIEPEYQRSIWAQQTLKGLNAEAARRKYRVEVLDARAFLGPEATPREGADPALAILMGTSMTWMPKALSALKRRGTDAVLISFDPLEAYACRGLVRMDYIGALDQLLAYFAACGRRSVALYGINPNSSADRIKRRRFESRMGPGAREQVFLNAGSLAQCWEAFAPRLSRFDGVICANDMVAVSLLKRLKAAGVHVPDQLFVAAFGDSTLARLTCPGITCASLDHVEMGRQAVLLFAALSRQGASASVSVRVRSSLTVRASTACMPPPARGGEDPAVAFASPVNFYDDQEIARLCAAEGVINGCDAADRALLGALLRGESPRSALFLTPSAVQYRKKRLDRLARDAGLGDLAAFLAFCRETALDPEAELPE